MARVKNNYTNLSRTNRWAEVIVLPLNEAGSSTVEIAPEGSSTYQLWTSDDAYAYPSEDSIILQSQDNNFLSEEMTIIKPYLRFPTNDGAFISQHNMATFLLPILCAVTEFLPDNPNWLTVSTDDGIDSLGLFIQVRDGDCIEDICAKFETLRNRFIYQNNESVNKPFFMYLDFSSDLSV
jgi:hypothetical protein